MTVRTAIPSEVALIVAHRRAMLAEMRQLLAAQQWDAMDAGRPIYESLGFTATNEMGRLLDGGQYRQGSEDGA